MSTIRFGRSTIRRDGPCYVIAEIGHNHQGSLETAKTMIRRAAQCGVSAVKFQKRDNPTLYTRALYNKPYDNENSYGETYGRHREHLEFDRGQYVELMRVADECGVEFMATAFDPASADFLHELGITSFKLASADITNVELIRHVARFGKPLFLSTGAASLEEIRIGYEAARPCHDRICLMHCVASYPPEYDQLNLRVIETLRREFPEAVIGYSGHDNGILASVIAYMLGATVVEKHFTLNHAWKGTDHRFSLEPEGLRKQVRDLQRVDQALGDGVKRVMEFEVEARLKMGKSLYTARRLPAGTVLTRGDIAVKSPAAGLPVYEIDNLLGRTVCRDMEEEEPFTSGSVQ